MFFCNKTIRIASLTLLSSLASSIQALPVDDGEANELITAADTATQQAEHIPLAPPGPYFSSAVPKETAISEPIQMPASVSVGEQNGESTEKAADDSPVHDEGSRAADQQHNEELAQKGYDIASTNPLAEWPSSVESNPKWAPAPPGPYGFVPNYTPRSAVNPTGSNRSGYYGYRTPYNSGNNTYGWPAPGMMRPQSNPGYPNPGYSNPSFSNQGYYYGRPNPGGYNQGQFNSGNFNPDNFNPGGFDPGIKRNNLNQNDINQAKPKY